MEGLFEKEKGYRKMTTWNYVEEYRELTEEVRHRGQEYATVQSILITGSLLAVTFALRERGQLESFFVSGIIVIAILLVFSALFMYYTTRRLDMVFLKRIKEIEPQIPVEMGHRGLGEKILETWWYKMRQLIWPIILPVLLFYYVSAFLYTNLPVSLPYLGLEEIGIVLGILGVLLAIFIPVIFEQWKKPNLDIIAIDERGSGTAPYKFAHVKVVNKPHKIIRFIQRNYVNDATAKIIFIDKHTGQELFTMPCKWTGKPEPLEPVYDPQKRIFGYVFDTTKIPDAQSINIAPGEEGEALDVAIKRNGEKECYGFNALSYAPRYQPGWKDPSKRIDLPECIVRVVVTSGDISKTKDLILKNPDTSLDDFVCI